MTLYYVECQSLVLVGHMIMTTWRLANVVAYVMLILHTFILLFLSYFDRSYEFLKQ